MNEIAIKPILFITPIILPCNSLPVQGPKTEFVHEDNESCSGSCSRAALSTQELSCYGLVMLRALVCLFPSARNKEEQWEQGEKGEWFTGVVRKVPRLEA